MTGWFYFIQKVLPSASSLHNPRWSLEPPGTGTRRTETLHRTDQTPWIDRSVETRGEMVDFLMHFSHFVVRLLFHASDTSYF